MNRLKYRIKYTGSAFFCLPVSSLNTGRTKKVCLQPGILLLFIFLGFNLLYCEICWASDEFSIKMQVMKNSEIPQTGDASELIVHFKPEYNITTDESGRIVSGNGKDTSQVNDLLKAYKAVIKPIGPNNQIEKILPAEMRFFVIRGIKNLESLRLKLLEIQIVDSAYIKPPAEDPGVEE